MIEPVLCAFCLAMKDAGMEFKAVFKGKNTPDSFGPGTGPRRIIAWYESLDLVGLDYIEYADWRYALIPIAFFEGTPLCEVHLHDVSDRYWRRRP